MKINIHDLMNNIEDSSVQLEETNVVSSTKIKELTKMKLNMTTPNTNRRSKKKILVVAVAASFVAALSIGAYAAFGGSLTDLSIAKETISETVYDTDGNPKETAQSIELISLQGFTDSPEYKAAKEWMDFAENYDQDRAILDAVGNSETQWDEKYGEYLVYSQEMADKMDEITAKYGLTLHQNFTDANKQELDAKFGTIMRDASYSGWYYDDGTFEAEGEFGQYDFQLGRTMKGTFDDTYLNIGNRDDYEEWTFETSDGHTVILALSKEKALILADLENSFVSVNVLLDLYIDDVKTMTRADLENMANHINFSIL